MGFKTFEQLDAVDCGPTCLRMVFAHHGKHFSLDFLRDQCYLHRMGVSMLNLSKAAEHLGCQTLLGRMSLEQLTREAPLPAIVHWNQEHFVVLYKISRPGWWRRVWLGAQAPVYHIADPAHGKARLDAGTFAASWCGPGKEKGIALLLDPGEHFLQQPAEQPSTQSLGFLFRYLLPYGPALGLVTLGMVLTTVISLLFPFLTQYLVDTGIGRRDLSVITLVLLAQCFLFAGDLSTNLLRGWLMLHINSRISIAIISDFLAKLFRLPIRFFDSKSIGDINQRIADHSRIELFLTGQILFTVFSLVNMAVYLAILVSYDWKIFGVFFSLSLLSVAWVFLFLRKRRALDYKRFQQQRQNQDDIYEMVSGMQEIKLNQAENKKRWGWERLQVRLFDLSIQSLGLEQYQRTGFLFATNLKNILLTFMVAHATVRGDMTLGMLLSISYIIGQTNGPLEQLIQFIRSAQDARISAERLQEIHNKNDEDLLRADGAGSQESQPFRLEADIKLRQVSFHYDGPYSSKVLDDVSFTIPHGKVTALVGASGSGKTTLLKLLLKFYEPSAGNIAIGTTDLSDVPARLWRTECGVVMQDGVLFADTIRNNIALPANGPVDDEQLQKAIYVANLGDVLRALPLGLETRLGIGGSGVSAGQKQRILIARAVYKNPSLLLFDEATSALDTANEKIIVGRLNAFFKHKTVLVIAHRLSTVKDADNLIVLNEGRVIEQGTHRQLAGQKGYYYELVKNQLELGS
ncbi:MAG: peptidase domain-containing ABC transporter [Saprospirales bacterium]|nr:peptidase domain-containing ABC transporter [Saprospirales bacterium]